ncbi:MAG TPA: M56 family metallopeptidase, partial [Vicinamibacterales bacterium]|nr:M56 family metallopeptidase [Vicinamibacterales bacterium]
EPDWARGMAGVWPAAFSRGDVATSAGDIVVRATDVEARAWSISGTVPALWMLGSAILFARLAVQALRLRRMALSGVVPHGRLAAIATEVASRLGLRRPELIVSEEVAIPLAWGASRPHLLLPPSADAWSDERLRAVCAHEMAHIARGDWLVHLMAEIVCRIYWFHPLLWMARTRLGRESEQAADDMVLGLGTSGADYASHLLEIVRAAQPERTPAATVAMARTSGLERRITMLLDGLVNRARLSRRRAAAIGISAGAVAAMLATLGARTPGAIEIRTSNLPPIDDSVVRLAGGDSAPVQDIRLIDSVPGDTAPLVVEYTTPPLYSDEARRAGIEGTVVVRAHVDAAGRVNAPRVTRALGWGLDQNAVVAVRQWSFRPGTRNGVATPMDVEIAIGFTRRNDAINAQIANDMVSLVGPGVTPPQAVRVMQPLRPATGGAGMVVLDVVLLENGTPRIVRILRSLGPDADDMAVRAFEQWRFSPALKDGRPIKVRVSAEVRFDG